MKHKLTVDGNTSHPVKFCFPSARLCLASLIFQLTFNFTLTCNFFLQLTKTPTCSNKLTAQIHKNKFSLKLIFTTTIQVKLLSYSPSIMNLFMSFPDIHSFLSVCSHKFPSRQLWLTNFLP